MNRLLLIGVIASLLTIGLVIGMIRTRKLQERHALLWLAGGVCIAVLGLSSSILDAVARLFGIAYAPSALFLIIVAFLGLALLDAVVTISRLAVQVRRLSQTVAVLEEKAAARDVRSDGTVPADAGDEGETTTPPEARG